MNLPDKKKTYAAFFMTFVLLFSVVFGTRTSYCDAVSAASENRCVYVSGMPIGLQMKSNGVVVTGFLGFTNENNKFVNPSLDAGVMIGDRITAISGTPVNSTKELHSCVVKSEGHCVLDIVRNKENYTISMSPDISVESHEFKLGLWVKDSAAGIGTLTFVDPENGSYAALGHGIGDANTESLFEISGGSLYGAVISNTVIGRVGMPGELQGYFIEPDSSGIGDISKNDDSGVYGTVSSAVLEEIDSYGVLMPVDDGTVIHTGDASILSTVSGCEPVSYSVEILSLSDYENSDVKNISLRITDDELLKQTGGIVQGMSGSPIIQDGCLVGAVTHVLVNDPTTGYGIYIENMLESAG